MNHLRRRESPTRDQFSFANSRIRRKINVKTSSYDGYKFTGRTKGIQFGNSYDADLSTGNNEEEFRWSIKAGGDEYSGTLPPQLWKNRGSPIRKSSENSPNSGVRQMEKFRQEMLEIIRDMPENTYELSLRDIVEPQRSVKSCERLVKVSEIVTELKEEQVKTVITQRIVRNGGGDIKMVGPRRGRKMTAGSSKNAKVSPRPSFTEAERSGGYSTDGERPKMNPFGGSLSSSYDSSNSSNGRAAGRFRKMTRCFSFFL